MSDDSRDLTKEKQEFMVLIVETIQEWGEIELELFNLFTSAMHPAPIDKCSAAFGSVINFKARINMTVETVKLTINNSTFCEEWANLCENLRRAAAFRNKIAHYTLVSGIHENVQQWFLAEPAFISLKGLKHDLSERDYITAKRVRDFKQCFSQRKKELREFSAEYHKKLQL